MARGGEGAPEWAGTAIKMLQSLKACGGSKAAAANDVLGPDWPRLGQVPKAAAPALLALPFELLAVALLLLLMSVVSVVSVVIRPSSPFAGQASAALHSSSPAAPNPLCHPTTPPHPPPSTRPAANHSAPSAAQPNSFADRLMQQRTRPCISPGKARNPGPRNRVRG